MISKIKFRNDVNNFWSELNDYISDYTSLTDTTQDRAALQNKLIDMADDFGAIIKKVYGISAGGDITQCMSGLIAGLIEAVALIENNVDTASLTGRVATNVIGTITEKLQALNSAWPVDVTRPIFIAIWTAWLEQSRAQLAKDITAFAAAEQQALTNSTSFAEAFVNGVFAQYNPIFY